MKVTYIGCKPQMNAHKMSFKRGQTLDVSDAMATNLLKIDGFVTSMNADAKDELKRNTDRETKEKAKLDSGIVYINNDEEVVALRQKLKELEDSDIVRDLNLDIDRLKKELKSSQEVVSSLTSEGKQKSILISELENDLENATKPIEPTKSVKPAKTAKAADNEGK